MRILLVEDNAGDARLVAKLLRDVADFEADLTVVTCLGEAGSWLQNESPPDLILLDLGLLDTTGYEPVTRILELAPSVPVVVLTGRNDEEVALYAVREGAQDYLLKSELTPGILGRAIRYGIERKRMQNTERFLASLGSLLSSTLESAEIIRRISELSVLSLGDCCFVDMMAEDGTLRRLGAAHRDPGQAELAEALRQYPVRLDRGHLKNVVGSGRPARVESLTIADLEAAAHDAHHLQLLKELAPRSFVAVPMFAREKFIGMITFVSVTRSLDQEDEALAERIGRIAGPELANSYLYERAREAVRVRDRVLGIVAHDLRNPLSAIQMSAELLLAPTLPPERRGQLLDIIRRSTARMDRLIQDLLDVAKIESDQLQLCLELQNTVQLAHEAVDLNSALAADRGITLEFESDAEPPQPVRADRDRVLQVLSNLIGNAIKFTPAGGRVTLRLQALETETLFSVIDTGPGISREDQAHLFTPFWQGRRYSRDGAGLGLSIAKGIVEGHGGKIWVQSDIGHGTTVTFALPNSENRRKASRAATPKLNVPA